MGIRKILAASVMAATTFVAGAANAALVFVGSWNVNDGLADSGPLSAQQAAAQLFGGTAADYSISTLGDDPLDVDFQAYYVVFGVPGATFLGAQDATSFFGFGLSAYAHDPELADRFINYAFVERTTGPGIPEPATWALMITGFGLAGAALRRRTRAKAA